MTNKHLERISNGFKSAVVLLFILVVLAFIIGALAVIAKVIMAFSTIAVKASLVVTALIVLFYVLGVLDERVEEDDR